MAESKPPAKDIRKARPMAPTLGNAQVVPTDTVADGDLSTALSNTAENSPIIDDDDAVIVPAPEASVFLPKAKPITSADARAKIQKKKRLEYRRTLIPILLTTGTMLMVFGMLKFLAGTDSTLVNLPNWLPIAFLSLGAILLLLAGINMLSVKHELAADGPEEIEPQRRGDAEKKN